LKTIMVARKLLTVLVFLTGVVGAQVRGNSVFDVRGVNTHYVMQSPGSRSDWEARRSKLRNQILSSAGLNPFPPRTALNPLYVRRVKSEFCTIDTILIQTMPGFYVGGNLYTPLHGSKKMPGVLVPHGHWKKGRIENNPDYSVPALAINLARQGYVVFAFDMIGYNDTKQLHHDFVSLEGELWSYTPMGLQLWNGIRALDFLSSLPNVNNDFIGVTGASGGGTQTFLLTAVDDRVRYPAPVNMVSAYMQGGDPCEEAPGLRIDTFNVEIAALAAPRPMQLISCTSDWTKHSPDEEYPAIRAIYSLYGHPERLSHTQIEAPHNYNAASREVVYQFFARHMRPSLTSGDLEDRAIGEIKDEEFLAGKSDAESLTSDQIFLNWKTMSREQAEQTKDRDTLRERLRLVFHAEYPLKIDASIQGDYATISIPGVEDRIDAFWRPGKGQAVLVVNPAGLAAARASKLVKGLVAGKRPILILDTFKPSQDRLRASAGSKYFYSYNLPDAVLQVHHILAGLSFLKSHAKGKPEIIAVGSAGVWGVFACAVVPDETELLADLNGFAGTDQDFLQFFFVPGIQRAGGLQTALRLTSAVHTIARFGLESPWAPSDDSIDIQNRRRRR
jgi:hypothetical protein